MFHVQPRLFAYSELEELVDIVLRPLADVRS